MNKNDIRKDIKTQKRQLGAERLHQLSFGVISRVLTHPRVKSAGTILLYYSLPDEVYTHSLADTMLLCGKRVVLPRVTGEGHMELRLYTGPRDLAPGAYNIMEPTGEVFNDYGQIDVAIIPGVAFDSRGNRLGRGKGYYDRFLPLISGAYKIGLCFDFQMVPRIPADSHDIAMDEVVSQSAG